MPGVYGAESEFEKNREMILVVRDYFAGLDFTTLLYPSTWGEVGEMFAGLVYREIPIDDEEALIAMKLLIDFGYIRMSKRNGLISFMRWSSLASGAGMVYSTDGHHPHSGIIGDLIKLEPMQEEGWFYFEVNRNEYMLLPTQGIDEMRIDFDENRNAILAVRDYFAGLEHNWLSFPIDWRAHVSGGRGVMFAGSARIVIDIDDPEIVEAVEFLLRQGYSRIEKRRGFIFFRRWGSERANVGIIYSADGSRPTSSTIPYLIETRRFEGEDNWFFFKANYWQYGR